MDTGTLLVLLLVLACPLVMFFAHRSGHRGHPHGAARVDGVAAPPGSLDSLRRLREAVDAEIVRLERAESETPAETGTPEAT